MNRVICIDGPSGAGKGTISQGIAAHLGWHLLDSGAIYRVLGVACQDRGIAWDDSREVVAVARDLAVNFTPGDDGVRVTLAGEDVTSRVRSELGGKGASAVAVIPEVRAALLSRQRELAIEPRIGCGWSRHGNGSFPSGALEDFSHGQR